MGLTSKIASAMISCVLATTPVMAHSHKSGKTAHRKHTPTHAKKHYLLHHDHHHINDPKHPRSPKWHPTNPHYGNFAD